MKLVLIIAGWLCIALGAIGLFLPILPTAPFVLLAAACFAKSSPRFYAWLLNNKAFGPFIRDWQQHRAIPRHAKRMAILTILVSGALSVYMLDTALARIAVVIVMTIPLWIIVRLPVLEPTATSNSPNNPPR